MANKKNLNDDKSKYYSYILINKTKRLGFAILCLILCILMSAVIGEHIVRGDKSWVYTAIPIFLLGIPLMLYPPMEQWIYKPWQAKAQKYERHYKD